MRERNTNTCAAAKKSLVIVFSYHHNNTARIASALSKGLNATVKTPDQVIIEEIPEYDLIGFGAGIDSGRHYKPLLDLVDRLPVVDGKAGFIFSTSAIQGEAKVKKDHSLLRQKLESKGYAILGEFSCKGFNTNSFLKYFGGMNKDRPNCEDLKSAEEFAKNLLIM
jgi:flavodoxin